jgi:MFS family permease
MAAPRGRPGLAPSRHPSRTRVIADGGAASESDPCLIEAVGLPRGHIVNGDRIQAGVDLAVHSNDRPPICWNDRSTSAQSWSDPTAVLINLPHLPARYAGRVSLTKLVTVTRREQPCGRLRTAVAALAGNAVNGNLRRAQLSFLGAWTAEWAFTVGLGIVAYRDGGATAVGLVGLLRMVPSAVIAPLAAPLADRVRRERVLVLVSTVRGLATAAAAIVVGAGGPVVIMYILAAVSTIAATLYRPAHSALLPSLCRSGDELASANVVRGLLDSVATLAGPLLAAVLLEFTDVAVVFAVASGASLAAAAVLLGLQYEAPPRLAAPPGVHLMAEAAEGIRAVVWNRDLALFIGLTIAQTFTRGALTVFTVVIALDLLRTGEPGVGALTAAVGAGAVIGSLAASLLVGSRRLAQWFGIGVALWGLPLALIPLFPQQAAVLALLACVGVGNALVDLGLFTLMARLASDEVLARVFGVLESLIALSVGLGALLASLLIDWFGARTAPVLVGALCPLLVVAAWRRLKRLDRYVGVLDKKIGLLQRVPMLQPLPLPAIEQLARALEPICVPAGHLVFRQGDPADRCYVIEQGAADVVRDGRLITRLRAGDAFGEIALLRRIPRATMVQAATDLQLHSLTCEQFLPIVTGFPPSARQARASVDTMLERFSPEGPADDTSGPMH